MGLANNGGINSFLTCSSELDAAEVLQALVSVGALKAAQELGLVLRELGTPVPSSSEEDRFRLLERHWSDALDEHDVLFICRGRRRAVASAAAARPATRGVLR